MAISDSRASASDDSDRSQTTAGAGSRQDGFLYDAFISYSRKNSDVADKIERDLQNFPLTREIRARLGRRHLNVFRDVNDLTGNRLTPALEQNLTQSRSLVVLCSPEARSSTYVGMEITRFAQLREANKIVPVLVAGVPNNDGAAGPAEWAFPDALGEVLGDSPLAPDLRNAWAVKRRSARLAVGSPWIQLVAGVVGVTPDDLTERITRAERHRLQRLVGAFAVILVVVSALAVFAWIQRNNALEQSLVATTRQLAATAKTTAETDLQSALVLADTAYRTRAEPQTIEALHAVLTTTPQLEAFYDFGEPVPVVDGTSDGGVLVGGTESGIVHRLDRSIGTMTEVMTLDGPIEFLSISDDGKTIAATGTRYDENSVAEASQSAVWQDGELILLPGKRIEAMSPSGHTIAMGFDDDTLEIVADGKQTALVHTARAAWVELPDDTVVVTMSGAGQFTRASVDGSNNETTQIPMGMSRVDGALSPNGARFTYISQDLENDVWDLACPLENQTGEATFTGRTGNARISDIALSYNGNRMATAAAGSIFVSDVQTKDAPSSQYTELRGAGPKPDSLRFLSDDVVLSASGSSAALWNLGKQTPLATRLPAEVRGDCGACGPPRVIVSPDAGKALIANNVLPGTSLVDLATGHSRSITFDGNDDVNSNAPPAMVWLDPERVFAYATNGDAWILTGDRLDVIEREFSLPDVSNVTRTVLRDDGTIVVLAEHGLVLVDPDTGEPVETGLNAVAVTTDGTYAVNFAAENGQENSTTVEIIDVASRQMFKKQIDGVLLNFVEHTDGNLALLRQVGGRESADTEVLLLSPDDGTPRSVEPLGTLAGATSSTLVSSADALFVDEAVEIGLYSLRNDLRLSLIPVESGHRAFNALGLSRDGTTLIIASQPAQDVLRVPVTADAWSTLACESAGRQLKPGELENIVKSTDGLVPGCGSSTTR